MSLFQAIFLGLIQGLTEFLPVSSSGHLVIFQKLFGLQPPVLFDVLVHVGTLGAIIFFLKKRLKNLAEGLVKKETNSVKLLKFLVIGSLPVAMVGLLLQSFLAVIFNSLVLVGLSLLTTSVLLFLTRKKGGKKSLDSGKALGIGLFQALALLPGISRSGATISAGLFQGLSSEDSFEFSFLLALPAILGALFLQLPTLIEAPALFLYQGISGMVVASLVGYWSLKFLKRVLVSKKFWLFGVYCLGLGLWLLLGF